MEEYKSDIGAMMEEQEKVPGFKDMSQRLGQEMANIKNTEELQKDCGEIQDSAKRSYLESHKTDIQDEDITMFPKPRKSCNICYGRGFEGALVIPGVGKDIMLCRCIKNRIGRKDLSEDKFLTYGEFQSILAHCNELFGLGEGL